MTLVARPRRGSEKIASRWRVGSDRQALVANDLHDRTGIVEAPEEGKSIAFYHEQQVSDALRQVRSVLAHEPDVGTVVRILPEHRDQSFSVPREARGKVAAHR